MNVIDNNFTESDSEDEELTENCVRIVKLDDCQNTPSKPLYALIIAPTRELVVQIKQHLTKAVKYTDIKVRTIWIELKLYHCTYNIDIIIFM